MAHSLLPAPALFPSLQITHFGLSGPEAFMPRHPHMDREYACLRPERDIVAPPVTDYPFVRENKSKELYQVGREVGSVSQRPAKDPHPVFIEGPG